MLKRTRETVRAAGEALGLVVPALPDAQTAAEQRRQELTAAQSALDTATAALEAGHDAGLAEAALVALEAAVSDARVSVDRAQRSYRAAERRLKSAADGEAQKVRAAAIVKRDEALAIRARAASEIDQLAAELAEQADIYDVQAGPLAECSRDGVTGHYTPITGRSLIEAAIRRAVAEKAGTWTGDKPPAVELAERVRGAVLA